MNKPTLQPGAGESRRSIEEEAAEWFGRCEIGLSPEQDREFVRWLETDTRHAEAMREMDETWDFLDRLRLIRRRPAFAAESAEPWKRVRLRWGTAILAAAAAVVVTSVVLWRSPHLASKIHVAATDSAGMKKMELPDGSVVQLNAGSAVEVRFSALERNVLLTRGEAYFTVAKDSRRPFVVTAQAVSVKAVGTAFNVKLESEGVQVFVTEGTVHLNDSARGDPLLPVRASATSPPDSAGERPSPAPNNLPAPTLLTAGQFAFIATAAGPASPSVEVRTIEEDEVRQALAWQVRLLDFDDTPLADVVAEFNRHNTHRLIIADSALAQQPFGGSFRADNFDVFVQLLEQRFGVVAERRPDRTILRRAR